MKNVILTILQNGYTSSRKHSMGDMVRYFYPLSHLLEPCDILWVRCNRNTFWSHKNNENRLALMEDLRRMSRNNVKDRTFFSIINRFENGDKYGIDIHHSRSADPKTQVSVLWSIDDVRGQRPDLNDEQALKVLRHIKSNHDCNEGVHWQMIRSAARTLFPEGAE